MQWEGARNILFEKRMYLLLYLIGTLYGIISTIDDNISALER